jgi:hypothetical protein
MLVKIHFFLAELQVKASLYIMQCIINKHLFLSLNLDTILVDFLNITLAPSEANDISLFVKYVKKKSIILLIH